MLSKLSLLIVLVALQLFVGSVRADDEAGEAAATPRANSNALSAEEEAKLQASGEKHTYVDIFLLL